MITPSNQSQAPADVVRRREMVLVVAAAAAGTAFEWYDFFVFGALAGAIARHFTAGGEDAGFVFALGVFAAGFFVRPFGALVLGRMGDRETSGRHVRSAPAPWAAAPTPTAGGAV